MKYDYSQPYIFTPNGSSSQAVIIPYTLGSGTGVAECVWCIAISKNKNVYIRHLGTWHYHCYDPEDNYVLFDVSPLFDRVYKKDLCLSFLYEERKKETVQYIRGEVVLNIKNTENNIEASLEPCRLEEALKIVALLVKDDCVSEWAFECLNNAFPEIMKDIKVGKDKIPNEIIGDLKKKIKRFYDERKEE